MRGNGSAGSDETGAQKFHSEVQRLIGQHLQATKGSPCVLELGRLVVDALQVLERNSVCRPRSSARKNEAFPFPVAGLHDQGKPELEFLRALMTGLTSLHSFGEDTQNETRSPAAYEVIKRPQSIVKSSGLLWEPLPDLDLSTFFSQKVWITLVGRYVLLGPQHGRVLSRLYPLKLVLWIFGNFVKVVYSILCATSMIPFCQWKSSKFQEPRPL